MTLPSRPARTSMRCLPDRSLDHVSGARILGFVARTELAHDFALQIR
jgi:hypothetical protein